MVGENGTEKSFDHISQRILFGLRLAFSNELPEGEDIPGREALEGWRAVMDRILEALYQKPMLLNLPLDPDQSFTYGQYHSENPALSRRFYKAQKIVSDFYHCLMQLGAGGEQTPAHNLKISKAWIKKRKISWKSAYQILLELSGVSCEDQGESLEFCCHGCREAIAGWQYLSSQAQAQQARFPKAGPFCFAVCNYSGQYRYWLERAERLAGLQPGYLEEIERICVERGAHVEAYGVLGSNEVGFYYRLVQQVSGFSIEYHAHYHEMIGFAMVNGLGIKAMLMNFDRLDPQVQDYLLKACHDCHECGACTKGGKVASFATPVISEGKLRRLCPLFIQREWTRLDMQWVRQMIAFGEMQEQYGAGHAREA